MRPSRPLPVGTFMCVAALLALSAGGGALAQAPERQGRAQPPATRPVAQPSATSGDAGAALTRYCVTCHNERLKTAGFVIDPTQLTRAGDHADTWEKVVRKLRTAAMPPVGSPRPDQATYDAVALSLERTLDAAAATRTSIGKLPLVHRLSRTEYQNAVRDVLALEHLPKELRIDYLLPADNISSGFDNIADLLFVSPTAMERYLDAAQKVSRLAVGDTTMPVLVNIHPLDPEHWQDQHVEDLPVGTRGGVAVRSEFPVDGDYVVKVELAGGTREPHSLEVTVDGARVALRELTQAPARGRGAGAAGGGGAGRGGGGQNVFEFPLALKAGPKLVGVAFLQRTEARDEATLRPRLRSRGTQPAIAAVTISGPHKATGPGDSPSRRRIFVCRPTQPADELPCATRILSSLARRAYRRPVTSVDIQDLLPFFTAGRTEGGFDLGVQKAIERMLMSTHFLFRIERQPSTARAGTAFPVSDLELASRLSFFLWSSVPDDTLLHVAESGRLRQPAGLQQQVRRMLADPKASSLVTNFAAQWLFLRDIEAKQPDEVLFQDFDETLRAALQRETELFVDSVFREDRSVLELLTANYSFLNERLARHYGVPNVRGSHFRRVTFPPDSPRGGLLGQGSLLTITSYATRTSPVLRGKWVLENLLAAPPPPPPPNVPALRTEGASPSQKLTMRDAMTAHRANPACASCHAQMDPIGFAMENFDAVGRWRDLDGYAPIDTSGVFPGGARFEGISGLKRELTRHPEQVAGTVAERLLMYALGRNLQYYDAPVVRQLLRDAAPSRYTLSALVAAVVKSRPFLMREAS